MTTLMPRAPLPERKPNRNVPVKINASWETWDKLDQLATESCLSMRDALTVIVDFYKEQHK